MPRLGLNRLTEQIADICRDCPSTRSGCSPRLGESGFSESAGQADTLSECLHIAQLMDHFFWIQGYAHVQSFLVKQGDPSTCQ